MVALISGAWALALLAASPVMVHTHLKVVIGLLIYLGYSTGDGFFLFFFEGGGRIRDDCEPFGF